MNSNQFISSLLELVNSHRTIVSLGSSKVVDLLKVYVPEGKILNYKSGLDVSNWEIPDHWELISASLIDTSNKEVILNEENSVLFVAPYSNSCDVTLGKSELIDLSLSDPLNPSDFKYQHRLAYDPNKTFKDIGISIPWKILESLKDDRRYRLIIKTIRKPGEMKLFRASTSTEDREKVFLLSHYCHSGQLNDGLAGVLVMGEVFKALSAKSKELKKEFVWLAFPETIGSSVYLSHNQSEIDRTYFSLFSEMPGSAGSIRITSSRRKTTYIDRLIRKVIEENKSNFSFVDFRKGWGNDEMVFDSTTVGIPSISIDRAPFPHYHLSSDNIDNFIMEKAKEIIDIILQTLMHFDRDYIPKANFTVPPQLSRLGLYKDWTTNRIEHDEVMSLLDAIGNEMSVIDVSIHLNISIANAFKFYDSLAAMSLISTIPVTPAYTRTLV